MRTRFLITLVCASVISLRAFAQEYRGTFSGTITDPPPAPVVSAELIASNASVGQTITTQEVEDLPVNGRTPIELATLAMGVVNTIQPGPVRPFDNPGGNFQMGGAPAGSNELLLDGAPDSGPSTNGTLAYSPPQDAVQEVRVNVFDTDAAYGHTNGGTINQILKNGGNTIHGAAYEFNQQSTLDANAFFTNKAGQPVPPYHQNQYGASLGGPIYIPKVYDGRNKLFWFFAYEGLRDSDPANSPLETGNPLNFATVPTTAAERNGDFSALLASNTASTNCTIYNHFHGSCLRRQRGPHAISEQRDSGEPDQPDCEESADLLSCAQSSWVAVTDRITTPSTLPIAMFTTTNLEGSTTTFRDNDKLIPSTRGTATARNRRITISATSPRHVPVSREPGHVPRRSPHFLPYPGDGHSRELDALGSANSFAGQRIRRDNAGLSFLPEGGIGSAELSRHTVQQV